MAYIVRTISECSQAPAAAFSYVIDRDVKANDLVVAICTQDTGTTAIVATGWTEIGAQAAVQGQRTAVFYKVAQSSQETFSATGTNEEWFVTLIVVRDADVSAPIDVFGSANSANSTTSYLDSPTITTTIDNCLVIYACGFDGPAKLTVLPSAFTPVKMSEVYYGCSQLVGYKVRKGSGAVSSVRFLSEVSSEGGACLVFAIKDKNPAAPSLPVEFPYSYQVVSHLSGRSSPAVSVASFTRHDNVSVASFSTAASSILGIGTATTAPNQASLQVNKYGFGAFLSLYYGSGNFTVAGWEGGVFTIPSVSMANKTFYTELYMSFGGNISYGPKGMVVVFMDASGNWAAFNVLAQKDAIAEEVVGVFISPGHSTPDDSFGVIDWSAITKIGAAFHRTSATDTIFFGIKGLILIDKVVAVGGCEAKPLSYASFMDQTHIGRKEIVALQGLGQVSSRVPIQIGDGQNHTHFSARASSVEIAKPWKDGGSIKGWFVVEGKTGIFVNASATDQIDFSGSIYSCAQKAIFEVASSSSPSASYDFSGFVVIGAECRFLANGVSVVGARFVDCFSIEQQSQMIDCQISDAVASPALLSGNPASLTRCAFTQGLLGGHAIEITQPGTFAFVGNTFEGYGLDGATDAAIYNNSGGHVTLNVSGGGDTPTVRNGAGATTDVVSGAQITVVGLAAGSQVKVTKVPNGDVLFNGAEAGGRISFPTTYIGAIRIDARKASASPFYKPWFSQANTVSGQTVEITALQELDE